MNVRRILKWAVIVVLVIAVVGFLAFLLIRVYGEDEPRRP